MHEYQYLGGDMQSYSECSYWRPPPGLYNPTIDGNFSWRARWRPPSRGYSRGGDTWNRNLGVWRAPAFHNRTWQRPRLPAPNSCEFYPSSNMRKRGRGRGRELLGTHSSQGVPSRISDVKNEVHINPRESNKVKNILGNNENPNLKPLTDNPKGHSKMEESSMLSTSHFETMVQATVSVMEVSTRDHVTSSAPKDQTNKVSDFHISPSVCASVVLPATTIVYCNQNPDLKRVLERKPVVVLDRLSDKDVRKYMPRPASVGAESRKYKKKSKSNSLIEPLDLSDSSKSFKFRVGNKSKTLKKKILKKPLASFSLGSSQEGSILKSGSDSPMTVMIRKETKSENKDPCPSKQSTTKGQSLLVDPKVMSLSRPLQKACSDGKNASQMTFKNKVRSTSRSNRPVSATPVARHMQLFDLEKLRNKLKGANFGLPVRKPPSLLKTLSDCVHDSSLKNDWDDEPHLYSDSKGLLHDMKSSSESVLRENCDSDDSEVSSSRHIEDVWGSNFQMNDECTEGESQCSTQDSESIDKESQSESLVESSSGATFSEVESTTDSADVDESHGRDSSGVEQSHRRNIDAGHTISSVQADINSSDSLQSKRNVATHEADSTSVSSMNVAVDQVSESNSVFNIPLLDKYYQSEYSLVGDESNKGTCVPQNECVDKIKDVQNLHDLLSTWTEDKTLKSESKNLLPITTLSKETSVQCFEGNAQLQENDIPKFVDDPCKSMDCQKSDIVTAYQADMGDSQIIHENKSKMISDISSLENTSDGNISESVLESVESIERKKTANPLFADPETPCTNISSEILNEEVEFSSNDGENSESKRASLEQSLIPDTERHVLTSLSMATKISNSVPSEKKNRENSEAEITLAPNSPENNAGAINSETQHEECENDMVLNNSDSIVTVTVEMSCGSISDDIKAGGNEQEPKELLYLSTESQSSALSNDCSSRSTISEYEPEKTQLSTEVSHEKLKKDDDDDEPRNEQSETSSISTMPSQLTLNGDIPASDESISGTRKEAFCNTEVQSGYSVGVCLSSERSQHEDEIMQSVSLEKLQHVKLEESRCTPDAQEAPEEMLPIVPEYGQHCEQEILPLSVEKSCVSNAAIDSSLASTKSMNEGSTKPLCVISSVESSAMIYFSNQDPETLNAKSSTRNQGEELKKSKNDSVHPDCIVPTTSTFAGCLKTLQTVSSTVSTNIPGLYSPEAHFGNTRQIPITSNMSVFETQVPPSSSYLEKEKTYSNILPQKSVQENACLSPSCVPISTQTLVAGGQQPMPIAPCIMTTVPLVSMSLPTIPGPYPSSDNEKPMEEYWNNVSEQNQSAEMGQAPSSFQHDMSVDEEVLDLSAKPENPFQSDSKTESKRIASNEPVIISGVTLSQGEEVPSVFPKSGEENVENNQDSEVNNAHNVETSMERNVMRADHQGDISSPTCSSSRENTTAMTDVGRLNFRRVASNDTDDSDATLIYSCDECEAFYDDVLDEKDSRLWPRHAPWSSEGEDNFEGKLVIVSDSHEDETNDESSFDTTTKCQEKLSDTIKTLRKDLEEKKSERILGAIKNDSKSKQDSSSGKVKRKINRKRRKGKKKDAKKKPVPDKKKTEDSTPSEDSKENNKEESLKEAESQVSVKKNKKVEKLKIKRGRKKKKKPGLVVTINCRKMKKGQKTSTEDTQEPDSNDNTANETQATSSENLDSNVEQEFTNVSSAKPKSSRGRGRSRGRRRGCRSMRGRGRFKVTAESKEDVEKKANNFDSEQNLTCTIEIENPIDDSPVAEKSAKKPARGRGGSRLRSKRGRGHRMGHIVSMQQPIPDNLVIDNAESMDSDELPTILPPKRRRTQQRNGHPCAMMQDSLAGPNQSTERIMREFPRHNWLEQKIKLQQTSGQASSTETSPTGSPVPKIQEIRRYKKGSKGGLTQSSTALTVENYKNKLRNAGLGTSSDSGLSEISVTASGADDKFEMEEENMSANSSNTGCEATVVARPGAEKDTQKSTEQNLEGNHEKPTDMDIGTGQPLDLCTRRNELLGNSTKIKHPPIQLVHPQIQQRTQTESSLLKEMKEATHNVVVVPQSSSEKDSEILPLSEIHSVSVNEVFTVPVTMASNVHASAAVGTVAAGVATTQTSNISPSQLPSVSRSQFHNVPPVPVLLSTGNGSVAARDKGSPVTSVLLESTQNAVGMPLQGGMVGVNSGNMIFTSGSNTETVVSSSGGSVKRPNSSTSTGTDSHRYAQGNSTRQSSGSTHCGNVGRNSISNALVGSQGTIVLDSSVPISTSSAAPPPDIGINAAEALDREFERHLKELHELEKLAARKELERDHVLYLRKRKAKMLEDIKNAKSRRISGPGIVESNGVQNLSSVGKPSATAVSNTSCWPSNRIDLTSQRYQVAELRPLKPLATLQTTTEIHQNTGPSYTSPPQTAMTTTSFSEHTSATPLNLASAHTRRGSSSSEDRRPIVRMINLAMLEAAHRSKQKQICDSESKAGSKMVPSAAHQPKTQAIAKHDSANVPPSISSSCPYLKRKYPINEPPLHADLKTFDATLKPAHSQPPFQLAGSLIVPAKGASKNDQAAESRAMLSPRHQQNVTESNVLRTPPPSSHVQGLANIGSHSVNYPVTSQKSPLNSPTVNLTENVRHSQSDMNIAHVPQGQHLQHPPGGKMPIHSAGCHGQPSYLSPVQVELPSRLTGSSQGANPFGSSHGTNSYVGHIHLTAASGNANRRSLDRQRSRDSSGSGRQSQDLQLAENGSQKKPDVIDLTYEQDLGSTSAVNLSNSSSTKPAAEGSGRPYRGDMNELNVQRELTAALARRQVGDVDQARTNTETRLVPEQSLPPPYSGRSYSGSNNFSSQEHFSGHRSTIMSSVAAPGMPSSGTVGVMQTSTGSYGVYPLQQRQAHGARVQEQSSIKSALLSNQHTSSRTNLMPGNYMQNSTTVISRPSGQLHTQQGAHPYQQAGSRLSQHYNNTYSTSAGPQTQHPYGPNTDKRSGHFIRSPSGPSVGVPNKMHSYVSQPQMTPQAMQYQQNMQAQGLQWRQMVPETSVAMVPPSGRPVPQVPLGGAAEKPRHNMTAMMPQKNQIMPQQFQKQHQRHPVPQPHQQMPQQLMQPRQIHPSQTMQPAVPQMQQPYTNMQHSNMMTLSRGQPTGHTNQQQQQQQVAKGATSLASYPRPQVPMSVPQNAEYMPPRLIQFQQNGGQRTVHQVPAPQQPPRLQQFNGCCVVCGAFAMYLCSSCRHVWYCSQPCQNSHWKRHASECKPVTQQCLTVNQPGYQNPYIPATTT